MRLDIRPGHGIGPVIAGMSADDVLAVMPEEEGVYEDRMGGNLNDCLLYRGLVFHFIRRRTGGPQVGPGLAIVTIHERDDATLFNKPLEQWTKSTILERLRAEGLDARPMSNGDVGVVGKVELSFGRDGTLTWVELYVP